MELESYQDCCKGLGLSGNWIKNEMLINHGTITKLWEITDIIGKYKRVREKEREWKWMNKKSFGTRDLSGAVLLGLIGFDNDL